MKRIVKAVYWRIVRLLARVSRSIEAVNEGYSPQGSMSNGPHQPMTALRDAVSLLGASTGRLESRLESISLTATGIVDRLVYSLVIAEVSRAPLGSRIALVGDFISLRIAADLADLSYEVEVHDTVETTGLELSSWVGRLPNDENALVTDAAVLVVASSVPIERLREGTVDLIDALSRTNPSARLVSCAPVSETANSRQKPKWRSDEKDMKYLIRPVEPTGHATDARRVTAVAIASQLP